MYAVTMKNIPITLFFAAIAVAQCVLGITMTILTGKNGGEIRRLGWRNRLTQP